MKRYRVMNKITNKFGEEEAESAQEACEKLGWSIGDCWVREYSPKGSGGWKKPTDKSGRRSWGYLPTVKIKVEGKDQEPRVK